MFGGGGLTNEKSYALGKFARVALRTANIDYNGRFCMAAAAAAGNRAFGIDRGLPFPLADIPAAKNHPAGRRQPCRNHAAGDAVFRCPACRRRHADRVRSTAHRDRQMADLHLQLTPGTDAALANGLLHVAIQRGLIDRDYIEARTTGFEARAADRRIILAGPGRAHHRRPRTAAGPGGLYAGRGQQCNGADRTRRGAAEQRRRQCRRIHQPVPRAWACRDARTAAMAA